MALTAQQIEQLAIEFSVVRRTAGQLEPPSKRFPGFSLQDGYAIAKKLEQRRVAEGHVPVGKKIGFSNQEVWPKFGLTQPVWAPMYGDSVRHLAELSLKGMAAPRIEAEIVFGLGKDLSIRGLSAEEILAAMRWYAIGFEIVDCHYPGWQYTPADVLADFGLHAVLVLGEQRPVQPAKAGALAASTMKLYCDGILAAEGRGRDVLGSPALAINWLLDTLLNSGIAELKAGEIVSTGTLTGALPLLPGQTWRAEVSGIDLSPLSLRLV